MATNEKWGPGRPLSGHALKYARSVEAYLLAGARPRWMERLIEVEAGIKRERRRAQEAYDALRAECPPDEFPERWRARAQAFDFDALNALIRRHNEWYPIERDLPIDLRTRDYVKVHGRSHRRPLLGPEWVLEQFPARWSRVEDD